VTPGHTRIVFGEPLPVKPLPQKPVPKKHIRRFVVIARSPSKWTTKQSMTTRLLRYARKDSKMIADILPREFVDYMGGCQNQTLIKRFSGKTLLQIAGLESAIRRQQVIGT